MPRGNKRSRTYTEKVQVLLSTEQLETAQARADELHLPLSVYFRALMLEDTES